MQDRFASSVWNFRRKSQTSFSRNASRREEGRLTSQVSGLSNYESKSLTAQAKFGAALALLCFHLGTETT